MYGSSRYGAAQQRDVNTRSFVGAVNEDPNAEQFGDNARVNVSRRIHSREYPIDMHYGRTLNRFYYCSPEVSKVEQLTIASLFQEPPTFMMGDRQLLLTTSFQNVVNTEYARFNEDAHVSIQTLGFVPVHYVVLASGVIVPRVVDVYTFEISVYTDYMSESQCYRVYRIIDGERQSWQTKTVSTNFTDGSTHSHLKALHDDLLRDPRETASMRMDMGLQFPKSGEVDPTIFIYDGFGTRPSRIGKLQSVMNAIYLSFQKVHHIEQLYVESLRQHMSSQPLIESSSASEEQQNDMSAYESREEQTLMHARDRMAEQQYDMRRTNMIYRQQRLEAMKRSVGEFEINEQLYAAEIDPGFSPTTVEDIVAYDSSAPVFSAAQHKKMLGVTLLPGEKVAGYSRAQTRFEHLPKMQEDYKTTVSNLLGKPPSMFDMNRGTQDQIALHLRNYFKIRHAQVKTRAGLLTTVYNQIYAPSESSWFAHVFFDRMLRSEVIQRIALDYKLYYTHIKRADPRLYALLNRAAPDMQDVVLEHMSATTGRKITKPKDATKPVLERKYTVAPARGKKRAPTEDRARGDDTPFKQLAAPGGILDDGLSEVDSEERAWQRKFYEPQLEEDASKVNADSRKLLRAPTKVLRNLQQAGGAESMEEANEAQNRVASAQQRANKEQQYDDMLINEEIRALMFLGALRQQDSDTIFSIYKQAGEAHAQTMRHMFDNFERMKEKSRVSITFKSAANLNLPDLLARVAAGYITKKESFDIVRTQMFMPVDSDTWSDSGKLDAVLKLVRENIAGSVAQSMGVRMTGGARGGGGAATSSSGDDSSTASKSKRAKLASNTESSAEQAGGTSAISKQLSAGSSS
jgi:hypothetical protein